MDAGHVFKVAIAQGAHHHQPRLALHVDHLPPLARFGQNLLHPHGKALAVLQAFAPALQQHAGLAGRRATLPERPEAHFQQDVFAAQAAGYSDVVAPTTFAVVIQERSLATVLADPEADIDFSRVVHGDQRFVHVRPIVAGDELTSKLKVASVKSLGGHSMVTFETEIFDASSELVSTAISTLVVRGGE